MEDALGPDCRHAGTNQCCYVPLGYDSGAPFGTPCAKACAARNQRLGSDDAFCQKSDGSHYGVRSRQLSTPRPLSHGAAPPLSLTHSSVCCLFGCPLAELLLLVCRHVCRALRAIQLDHLCCSHTPRLRIVFAIARRALLNERQTSWCDVQGCAASPCASVRRSSALEMQAKRESSKIRAAAWEGAGVCAVC